MRSTCLLYPLTSPRRSRTCPTPGPPRQSLELNDYEIKVVKLRGEFVWHDHQETDELFLVISGQLTIQMHDENVALGPGQLFVVPRGVQHCPITAGEVHAVLIEPRGVVNTGEAGGSLTTVADNSPTSGSMSIPLSGSSSPE